jgi:HK97 family phage major capsid protein
MPSVAQLQAQKDQLQQKLATFTADTEMSQDEKDTAFKTLQEEFETWSHAAETCESASKMDAALKGFGGNAARDAETDKFLDTNYEAPSPFTREGKKALARETLRQETKRLENTVWAGVNGHRAEYDFAFEIGTKDATEANNLMGEGLYGATGPTAAGQNPFLPGAFGPGILPDFRPGIVEKLFYELTIADLISSFATSAPNISYLTESVLNPQANAVAESALYPWSSLEVSRVYAQVGKIANAMTISDEAVADAPTLYQFIQSRLLFLLQRQEEVQILAASGYPGVGGLLSFASNFTASSASSYYGATTDTDTAVAFPPAGTNGAGVVSQTIASLPYGRVVGPVNGLYPSPILTALNLKDAFVDIELAVFHSPTAVVMHPRDWQILETAQDANGQFMNGSFFGSNYGVKTSPVKSIWNVPVVTTPLMPQGSLLTGWFDPQSVQIARRQGISMQMTNSNGTDFVQGNITMRAEERLGLLCYRPQAFELVQLTAVAT